MNKLLFLTSLSFSIILGNSFDNVTAATKQITSTNTNQGHRFFCGHDRITLKHEDVLNQIPLPKTLENAINKGLEVFSQKNTPLTCEQKQLHDTMLNAYYKNMEKKCLKAAILFMNNFHLAMSYNIQEFGFGG